MANLQMSSRVSPEGRVVIPAEARRALGLKPGDVVYFTYSEVERRLEVHVVAHMVEQMWANAPADPGDSAAMVRAERQRDNVAEATSGSRMSAAAPGTWDESTHLPPLLSELGLE